MTHDDLNDDISDLIGSPMRTLPVTPPATYKAPTFDEPCSKCGGSGRWYGGRTVGTCFKCMGKGSFTFKQSPEKRAQARASTAARKDRVEAEKAAALTEAAAAFTAAHLDEVKWLAAASARPGFDFPAQMIQAIAKFGSLTTNQLAAVQRLMARDAERKVERVAREAAAPEISVAKIEDAFRSAKRTLKWPKLSLDTFTFKPAGEASKNAGSIYVTEGEQYLGKITAGRFICTRECGPDRQARILAAAADPKAAAQAYGQRFGNCSCCGRELTNQESIDLGIGPICAEKFGW